MCRPSSLRAAGPTEVLGTLSEVTPPLRRTLPIRRRGGPAAERLCVRSHRRGQVTLPTRAAPAGLPTRSVALQSAHASGALLFPTDLSIRPDRRTFEPAGQGLRIVVGHRAHAHPYQPANAVAGRAASARRVPPHPRPGRCSGSGRGGDRTAAPRHRHLPRRPASTRSRWPSRRFPRSPVRRSSCSASASGGTRTRWRTTASTRRRGHVPASRALAMRELWPQDEAAGFDGDQVQLLRRLELAQAGAVTRIHRDHGRCRPTGDVPRRRRVLRRLDADPLPNIADKLADLTDAFLLDEAGYMSTIEPRRVRRRRPSL